MNLRINLLLAVGVLFLQGCSTVKNDTIWVSGFTTDCNAVAQEAECLYINKGNNLEATDWEFFYSDIQGFQMEEGMMTKVEVKTEELDIKDVPADASRLRYTFVKEVEKKTDPRVQLNGNWILATMNGGNLNRMIVLPTLNIDLKTMGISGNGGCNDYFGGIETVSTNKITLTEVGSTRKHCENENIEHDYFRALSKVKGFEIKKEILSFLDENGAVVLSYLKVESNEVDSELSGEWTNTQINKVDVSDNDKAPRLSFDLDEMKISGNDGCNGFFGQLNQVTSDRLLFSEIGTNLMMCDDMEIPDLFSKALLKVSRYKIQEGKLFLYDVDDNLLLVFTKLNTNK